MCISGPGEGQRHKIGRIIDLIMASKFRNLIGSKCRQSISTNIDNVEAPSVRQIISRMKLRSNLTSIKHPISITLPVASLGLDSHGVSKFIASFETDSNIPAVFCSPDCADSLVFDVDRNSFFSRELAIQLRREQQGSGNLFNGFSAQLVTTENIWCNFQKVLIKQQWCQHLLKNTTSHLKNHANRIKTHKIFKIFSIVLKLLSLSIFSCLFKINVYQGKH